MITAKPLGQAGSGEYKQRTLEETNALHRFSVCLYTHWTSLGTPGMFAQKMKWIEFSRLVISMGVFTVIIPLADGNFSL